MIKRILILVIAIQFTGCAELQNVVNQVSQSSNPLSQEQIGNGLREALDNGIKNQVSKLTATDGFYKNDLVKIMLPAELKAVDSGLRKIVFYINIIHKLLVNKNASRFLKSRCKFIVIIFNYYA